VQKKIARAQKLLYALHISDIPYNTFSIFDRFRVTRLEIFKPDV